MRQVLSIIICLTFAVVATAQDDQVTLNSGTVIRFANVAEGKQVLGAEDEFIKRLSQFDLQARLHSTEAVKRADYLKVATNSVVTWNEEQRESLSPAINRLAKGLNTLKIRLPEEILLVQVDGGFEANAPHTRANAIILPKGMRDSASRSTRLLAHETFHILSRFNHRLRDALYQQIGYKKCNEIRFSKALESQRLTNPDAPIVQHYIMLDIAENEGTEKRQAPVTQVLFSGQGPYRGQPQPFFQLMKMEYVELQEADGRWIPKTDDATRLVTYQPGEVSGFLEQVGQNTGYIIHPEEILADNFAMLLTGAKAKSPEIIEKVRTTLEAFQQKEKAASP